MRADQEARQDFFICGGTRQQAAVIAELGAGRSSAPSGSISGAGRRTSHPSPRDCRGAYGVHLRWQTASIRLPSGSSTKAAKYAGW